MDLIVTLGLFGVILVAAMPAALSTVRTYYRNGAARHVLAEIRRVQSLAVTRRGIYGYQWGGDAAVTKLPSEYRIVRDATGACGVPAENDPADGVAVVTGWTDLTDSWPGVTIESIVDSAAQDVAGVMFDSRGRALHTCAAVTYPVRVTVAGAEGLTRVIEVQLSGGTRLL